MDSEVDRKLAELPDLKSCDRRHEVQLEDLVSVYKYVFWEDNKEGGAGLFSLECSERARVSGH